ncbi:MAG: ParB/RepB/Spo0J family partition protein [Bryobacterales bacterium]|nr:ParB/RepB/Spo0J family partition protein [Bryobacterales bacterium]
MTLMTDHPPSAKKRPALGRGLSAILPTAAAPRAPSGQAVAQIPVGLIDPNPVQPRSNFDEDALRGLAESIRADGVLQPLLVRPAGSRYTLIVGERRLKAARLAGLTTVPSIVREIEADRLLEATLVENIQREDLNPIEIALALEQMLKELEIVQDQLAERTGMSRTSVTNHLRLLKLPLAVIRLVRDGKLQMGHARALLALDSDEEIESVANRAVETEMSVRSVEEYVRRKRSDAKRRRPQALDPNIAAAIENLERVLQAPVRLRGRGRKGRIEIAYSSPSELEAIYDRIVGEAG